MMASKQCVLMVLFVASMAMGANSGIVPEANQDPRELTTFGRNFWSTADKQHYRISENGQVAEIVLDERAGILIRWNGCMELL